MVATKRRLMTDAEYFKMMKTSVVTIAAIV
jgi:hypothetical protein